MTESAPHGDPLGDVLADIGMTGVFYATSTLHSPWGIDMPPLDGTLVFHLVTRGEALIEVAGESIALRPGSVVLVPHGRGHLILDTERSEPTPLFDLPRVETGDRHERVHLDGPGPLTELVCGAVSFTGLGVARLLAGLPPVVVCAADGDEVWVGATLELIGAESRHPRPGSDVVTARLADVLVVHAVRTWLTTDDRDVGWVAALRDPVLARSLAAFHADPARAWTLADLAAESGVSRSSYAARFGELMGEPVGAYLTQWRMDLAARLVRGGDLPLSAVAVRVGYRSESAFNRAFRRAHGMPPGAFARRGSTFRDHVPAVPALR